jgi:predicted NUDIX family NTP pyrophosphohydrolase
MSLRIDASLKNPAQSRERQNKEPNTEPNMRILSFDNYLNERTLDKGRDTAGIAAIYANKILLIHPTNSSWKKATCGIPKGKMEVGEDPMEAAIREFGEETGISVSPQMLDPEIKRVNFYNKKGEVDGHLFYFTCEIGDLSELGLTSERVPKTQLQMEEVDWGKFVSPEEAYPIMSREQLIILDRHLSLNK